MTNKELFVEYLRFNNIVPADFNQDDLPNWDILNMDAPMSWEYGEMNPMYQAPAYGAVPPYGTQPYYGDEMSQRMWRRPRRYRPGYGPRYNNPLAPLFWWWLLF